MKKVYFAIFFVIVLFSASYAQEKPELATRRKTNINKKKYINSKDNKSPKLQLSDEKNNTQNINLAEPKPALIEKN